MIYGNKKRAKAAEVGKFGPAVYGSGELTFIPSANGEFSSLAEADEYLRSVAPLAGRERKFADFFIDGYDAAAIAAAKPLSVIAAISVIVLGIVLDPAFLAILPLVALLGAVGFAVPAYYKNKASKCDTVYEKGDLHCAVVLRVIPGSLKTRVTYLFSDNGRERIHSRKFITDDDIRELQNRTFIIVAYDKDISRSISVPVIPMTEKAQ